MGEFELDDFIDQLGSNGFSQVLFVTRLGSDFTLDFFAVFVFAFWLGWFDNIGGRRLGRGAGVFLELGFEFGDFCAGGLEL